MTTIISGHEFSDFYTRRLTFQSRSSRYNRGSARNTTGSLSMAAYGFGSAV